MSSSSTRLVLLALGVLMLPACEGQPTNSVSVYEALFDEIGGLERTFYIREIQVRPGYPIDHDFEWERQPEFAFPAELSTHSKKDFGSVDVSIVSEAEFVEIFGGPPLGCEERWSLFYERYPQASGLMSLSPVGFTERGDEAAVFVSIVNGCLSGVGQLWFLEKKSSEWVVAGSEQVWIS